MSHAQEWEAAQKSASKAAAAGGDRSGREARRAFDAGIVVRWLLHVIAVLLIGFAGSLTPESAIHEIYQLNLISTGLILIAASGVWGAVSALAARLDGRR